MALGDNAGLILETAALQQPPLLGGPHISCAWAEVLDEIPAVDHNGVAHAIQVPRERPLTVYVDGRELVTLLTLGARPEWLVVGYLRNQRLIADARELASIVVDWELGAAHVTRREGARATDPGESHPLGGAGCNLNAGFASWIVHMDAMDLRQSPRMQISRDDLFAMLGTLRKFDSIFQRVGTVHGCALFCGTELWLVVEDVSRRNAMDTVAGWMALHGIGGADKLLLTTGRVTAETVMKVALNGIPVIVSRKGVTSMGRDLAVRLGMTLFGRAADHKYLCYCGADRFGIETGGTS